MAHAWLWRTAWISLALWLTWGPVAVSAGGQSAPGPATVARGAAVLNGTWLGTWESPNGSRFEAHAVFEVTGQDQLEGRIIWKLLETTREDLQPKLGQTGIEYVRGGYRPDSRVLALKGYRLDDPQQILAMDDYRLLLAENSLVIGGITRCDGSWTGIMSLHRPEGSSSDGPKSSERR